MPYEAYEDQYGIDVTFVWDQPDPLPDYRHQVMECFYRSYELDRQRRLHTVYGLIDASLDKLTCLRDDSLDPESWRCSRSPC